jgi:gliding motility-associated-like protein
MPAGIYHFTAGQGNCLIVSPNYEIPSIIQVYNRTNVSIIPATCNQTNGKISVTGNGGNATFTFKWFDEGNNEVGNSEVLQNLSPGKYRLDAFSSRGCTNTVGVFDVPESPLPSIDYSALQKYISCDGKTASTTGIAVIGSTAPYAYVWLDENDNVVSSQLNINAVPLGKYTLKITDKNGCVVDGQTIDFSTLQNTALIIPNSITPNGDGINDVWQINGAQNYNTADFSIYSRDGNRIYYSRGYAKPFDGIYKGKVLPIGVYYYVIDLKTDCGTISGSLTILR